MTSAPKNDQRPQPWAGAVLPDLQVERVNAERGTYWLNQQQGLDAPVGVEIHPDQVRYLAEQMGVVRTLTNDEAAAREAMQFRCIVIERDLARLRMAVDLAASMAKRLHDNICIMDKRGHEDLNQEMEQALALVDLLDLINEDPPDHVQKPALPAAAPDGNAPVAPAPLPAAQARAPGPARASVKPPSTRGAPGLFDGAQP